MSAPSRRDPGGALLRYRILANVVGVGLVILVFVGVPLQVGAGNLVVVKIVGPLHGFLYMAYLLVAFELTLLRLRWPLVPAVLVLAAGTIPLMSFVVERRVTAMVRAGERPAAVWPPLSPRRATSA